MSSKNAFDPEDNPDNGEWSYGSYVCRQSNGMDNGSSLEIRLTGLIRLVEKWNKPHNMKLSDTPGKCVSILFTNNRKDRAPEVQMNGKTVVSVTQTKLLGVIMDAQLTMKPPCMKLVKDGKSRVAQLCCVANRCFGPSQLSLRNIYVAYICSVFDYTAPSLFPLMSQTYLSKLEQIQNRAL